MRTQMLYGYESNIRELLPTTVDTVGSFISPGPSGNFS